MLVRVCLILAIVTSLGTILLSQFKVRPHIQTIINDRNTYEQNWHREEERARKLDANLRETQRKLTRTENTLKETQTQLAAATKEANAQRARANDLQNKLDETTSELRRARQDLEAWDNLGLPIEAVRAVIDNEKKLRVANAALKQEQDILRDAYERLARRYTNLVAEAYNQAPPMPEGLHGKVLVVDPKWQFVVLDIGSKDGAVVNGLLMVSRNSKLIGKVRIVTVEEDRCVANILPEWQIDDIMEGDDVIY